MEIKTVLVIEDNEMNMKLVRTLLQLAGHEVLEAINAEKGMQLAYDQKPDLILMDVQLPGMSGLCATKKMQADAGVKDIPVIMVTSCAMDGDREKAMKAGCIGYIAKPIDTRIFIQTINEFWNNYLAGLDQASLT